MMICDVGVIGKGGVRVKEMLRALGVTRWGRGCVVFVVEELSSRKELLYIEKGANEGRADQVRRENATARSKDCRQGYGW